MKAYEVQNVAGVNQFKRTELPQPSPGCRQVLIKVKAVSINDRDRMIAKGVYPFALSLPLIPLSDGVGEVVALGDGVTRVKLGDRVCGNFVQKWVSGELSEWMTKFTLGSILPGLLAEYAVLDEESLVQVPEHLTDEEAATLPSAALTAWHSLLTEGGLQAGDTVLLQGTSAVSLFALQFAHFAGARVIITSSSDAKLSRVKELGASDVINYKQTPDWEEQVLQLTQGRGVDYVVEMSGGASLAKSMQVVRLGGTILMVGAQAVSDAGINALQFILGRIRLRGILTPGHRESFEAMNRAISIAKLRPIVDSVFEFEQAQEAFDYMNQGKYFGKISIRV
ncbi:MULTISPECIES: NAD(P)-dependent alcohol dehydrogenase [unclassified Nostoc]|uniref:zinc-dependent alcohol dehydrogenase family protein n=1 Tax=unclassified Nostoc TaxID=2593658 RepID=UPI0025AB4D77|nr:MULTISPECIES: NAD(P)-dependent alcohol dehydrogenase [unclassified Nostoc]MDM9584039.1 NAD(P)-dependent alcohol dehydrogenase [Nostoc sp. GT001]MDZ7943671.1 NAD(P)-dependent alcohol dehydrogenase [Nostoc sp. EfeVER01]MDZ7991678.1 NAD(P)-dependent alcohol dehydrogenase [Nostoc sp. EspVER01]